MYLPLPASLRCPPHLASFHDPIPIPPCPHLQAPPCARVAGWHVCECAIAPDNAAVDQQPIADGGATGAGGHKRSVGEGHTFRSSICHAADPAVPPWS